MLKKQDKKESGSDDLEKPWECQACTFKNHPKISTCEMCTTQKKPTEQISSKIDVETIKKSGFACHACEHELSALKSKCPNCGEILIPDQDQQHTQKKKSSEKKDSKFLECLGCGEENDPTNDICVFCEQNLGSEPPSAIFPSKRRAPRKPRAYHPARVAYNTCQYCKVPIYENIESHEASCTHLSGQQLQIKYLTIEKKQCMFCYEKMQSSAYDEHEKSCTSHKQFYAEASPTYQRTTKLQKDTMIYMHKKSQKLHWIAQDFLLKRIISLGFKANQLQNLHHYIVNYAPIIIHMHVNSHMQFFVKDTHYRNQFQTKKSSGSLSQTSRISWQDRMFDHKHHSATPFERVKYGTINFTNDPRGVKACVGYGQSYFLLKPHVRNRCTVTDMDSSSPSATIATFQFCYHLLNKLPDAELKAAFEGSKANEVESNVIGTYKEIQIHGPIEFKKDIERVYVNKAELGDPKHLSMVKQFCKKNDLEYEIFQQPAPKVVYAPFGGGGFGFGSGGLGAGGLFGSSMVGVGGFSSFGVAPATSLFSAPRPSYTTTHLFGGGFARRYSPGTGLIRPDPEPKQEKQLQEGVDYI